MVYNKRKANMLFILLLSLTLLIGAVPLTAPVAYGEPQSPEIQIGKGDLATMDRIYFGEEKSTPIEWRILDGNHANTGDEKGMFVLSENLLGQDVNFENVFDSTNPKENLWLTSDLRIWCQNFYKNNFNEKEKTSIMETVKTDTFYTIMSVTMTNYFYAAYENILNGDKLFMLSGEEAENPDYGFKTKKDRIMKLGDKAVNWWLRSRQDVPYGHAGVVTEWGHLGYEIKDKYATARPAFNLNKENIVLVSLAENGKNSGEEGPDALMRVGESDSLKWKLTLKDEERAFTIGTVTKSGNTLTVTYDKAKTGAQESVSAIIARDGKVLYYGTLKNLDKEAEKTGEVMLNLPADFAKGDKIYLFNENINSSQAPDYSSSLQEISVPEGTNPNPGTNPTPNPGTTPTTPSTGPTLPPATNNIVATPDDNSEAPKEKMGRIHLVARSETVTMKNGKRAVKITWHDGDGKELQFDWVEIYRSTKKNMGYGKKPFFVTTKNTYFNTAIKKGETYYYKVRGVVELNGEKVYTEWSVKAIRTVK